MAELSLGIARARLGPSAALLDRDRGAAACEESRLARARRASTDDAPDLALAELLAYVGRSRGEIGRVGIVRDPLFAMEPAIGTHETVLVDAHRAHAAYSFAASGFETALVVVCDTSNPMGWSAFSAHGSALEAIDPTPIGSFAIAQGYGTLTSALGLHASRDEHLVESMARAGAADRSGLAEHISLTPSGLTISSSLAPAIADSLTTDQARLDVAAAIQRRLGEALVELLHRLARETGADTVCLSGGLFFNTHFTTLAAHCGAFSRVFIPAHPGRSGSAVGAAIAAGGKATGLGSPYLGPGYSEVDIKAALENCKLSFDLQREEQVIDTVIRALQRGRLVGWFHGRLEWGPRALGHRTVLADPFSAHVLDNLNGYLKQRPWYRSYGVSVPANRLNDLFEVCTPAGLKPRLPLASPPQLSPFMQFEYRPRDLDKFRTILPKGVTTVRVHTVDESEPRYLRLLEKWGAASGLPVLVNTSFNGFHEPLVCTPRDAIRVFYGTGLDLLALEDFILRK